ncbi:MAG: hypothetical protein ABSE06_00870 [Anaerolineaceae bacterium]|jgi:hypothetical protein
MNKKFVASIILLVIMLITLPFIYSQISEGSNYVFSGFLFNPVDGNSYLAKMQEGWSGSWQFTLPYTAEPGSGTYLFLFYIFLGHLARWLHLPLLLMFHVTRIVATICLFWVLSIFLTRFLKLESISARRAFLLLAFCSGVGWLAFLLGAFTSDFWVAEAYPFLSSYANPHFPLGLALLLGIFILVEEKSDLLRNIVIFFLSLLLAVILPFGIVVSGLMLFGLSIWKWIESKEVDWLGLFSFVVGGLPFALYQLWISQNNPVLKGWNAQNLTPSPPIWDFMLSFSPIFVLALYGAWIAWRSHRETGMRLLILWFIVGIVLIYFPFSLQRRFMLGFYIPSACLGVIAIQRITRKNAKKWLWPLTFFLSVITNIMLILAGIFGVMAHAPAIFLEKSESQALAWISTNTPKDSIILASPDMGSFIPADTGRKVLYGHPFETVNAELEKSKVQTFFKGDLAYQDQVKFLEDNKIGYIFWGPREKALGAPIILNQMKTVYQNNDVVIFGAESLK